MTSTKYAFRCAGCGHLEVSAHAGRRSTPTKCRVCSKTEWEVLADLPADQLKALGLTVKDVHRHKPHTKEESHAANQESSRRELAQLTTKEKYWQANKDVLIAEYQKLLALVEVPLPDIEDPQEFAVAHQQRDNIKQRMAAIEGMVYTERDAEAKTVHANVVASTAETYRAPKDILRSTRESPATKEKA